MNYGKIDPQSVANGEGIRVSLFVSGCPIRCEGCHNPELWNPDAGQEFTEETYDLIAKLLRPDFIKGITILGGEPLYYKNVDTVREICHRVRLNFPDKDIWIYSGYSEDECLIQLKDFDWDVLVCEPFQLDKRDITQQFMGSTNQKIIYNKK